jgi:hypothetical protein
MKMKIVVLNGRPKGENNVTLQYVHFIRKKYLQRKTEKDRRENRIMLRLKKYDIVYKNKV